MLRFVFSVFTAFFLSISCVQAADTAYQLGLGDHIRIQVTGEDDMTVEAVIGESGTISYPYLGDIRVTGRTVAELDKLITDKLTGPYLVDPDVNISLLTEIKFFVSGHVEKPGGYPYEPGLTVRKAISLAGGFDQRANKKRIFVVRGGEKEAEPELIGLDDTLYAGDTITVERSFF